MKVTGSEGMSSFPTIKVSCSKCNGNHHMNCGQFVNDLPDSWKEYKFEHGYHGGYLHNFWGIATCPECGLRTHVGAYFKGKEEPE